MQAIRKYSCKYLDNKHTVYAISSNVRQLNRGLSFKNHDCLTIPFYSHVKSDTYNVLTTFLHEEHARAYAKTISSDETECASIQYSLVDISYYGRQMNMPVVVIIDGWCDLSTKDESFDIFYTSRYLETTKDYDIQED